MSYSVTLGTVPSNHQVTVYSLSWEIGGFLRGQGAGRHAQGCREDPGLAILWLGHAGAARLEGCRVNALGFKIPAKKT